MDDFSIVSWLAGSVLGVPAMIGKIAFLIIGGASIIIQFVGTILLGVVEFLISGLFNPTFYTEQLGGFAANPLVNDAWSNMAGLCNILFIVALLFIGVGTIFRIDKYNYKKLLIRLVIVAFLTNFSLLFSGIILDFFHVLMFSLGNPLDQLVKAVKEISENQRKDFLDSLETIIGATDMSEAATRTGEIVLGAVFTFTTIISLLAIGVFLLIRVVALWFLLILSPFAYASMILPDTQSLSQRWWKSFMNYAMLGPALFFFSWFAARVINALGSIDAAHIDNAGTMFGMLLSVIVLWGALVAAASFGTYGASTVSKIARLALPLSMAMTWRWSAMGTGKAVRSIGQGLKKTGEYLQKRPGVGTFGKTAGSVLGKTGTYAERTGKAMQTARVLEPISTARGILDSFKRRWSINQKEDAEARRFFASAMLHPFRTFGKNPREAAAAAEQEKKIEAAAARNRIAAINAKENPSDEDEEERTQLRTKLGQDADGKELPLDQLTDENYLHEQKIKETYENVRNATIDQPLTRAADIDRVWQEGVGSFMQDIKGKDNETLTSIFRSSGNRKEKEAIVRQIASTGLSNFSSFLSGLGYNTGAGEAQKFFEKEFGGGGIKGQRQRNDIMVDLTGIGKEKGDLLYSNLTRRNPVTNEIVINTKEEQIKMAKEAIAKQSPEKLPGLSKHELESKEITEEYAKHINDNGKLSPSESQFKRIPAEIVKILEDNGTVFATKEKRPIQNENQQEDTPRRRAGFV